MVNIKLGLNNITCKDLPSDNYQVVGTLEISSEQITFNETRLICNAHFFRILFALLNHF